MRNFYTIVIVLFFISCKQNNDQLSMILENKYLVYGGDSINIIEYYLVNNSETTYYVNNLVGTDSLKKYAVYKNGINLLVYNSSGNEVTYNPYRVLNRSGDCLTEFSESRIKALENTLRYDGLMYFRRYENDNLFFIHPKETLFFEYSIDLSKIPDFDGSRANYVKLNSNELYSAQISLASDSTNYKTVLPRNILKSIKSNRAKVYHGTIVSDKIPVKIVN